MNVLRKIYLSLFIISILGGQSCSLLNVPGITDLTSACSHTETYTPVLQNSAQTFNVGKTVFPVVIEDITCTAVSGISVEVAPEMDMGMGNIHGTPVESVTDNGDGSYNVTAYFLMPGDWNLHFRVNNNHLTEHITITVGGTMMDKGTLKGVTDMTTYWGASHNRPYNIFISDASMIAMGMIDLFVTTWESETNQIPVFLNQILHTNSGDSATAWTVGTVTLEVCSIWANSACTAWLPLVDQGNGHFTAPMNNTMAIADAGTMAPGIAVHLHEATSTEWKTTDGLLGTDTGDGPTEFTKINR